MQPCYADFVDFANQLPGQFFMHDLNNRFIFHNKTLSDHFLKVANIPCAIGMDARAFLAKLDPKNTKENQKYATLIEQNTKQVLKERKGLAFEEKMFQNGKIISLICFRSPLFDEHGYLIGRFGYGYMMDQRHNDDDLHEHMKTLIAITSEQEKQGIHQSTLTSLSKSLAIIQAAENR